MLIFNKKNWFSFSCKKKTEEVSHKHWTVYIVHANSRFTIYTLLHWNISPSSNSRVRTPTGSSWIDLPQNFEWMLVSAQNFHPLPSQWQAMRVGWWLTCFTHNVSEYRIYWQADELHILRLAREKYILRSNSMEM